MSDDHDSGYSTSSSSNWDAPAPAEGGMDMSNIESGLKDIEENERVLAGECVTVKFALPSGESATHDFPHGQTVQFLKMWLEENHSLDYFQQVLTLGKTVLIDPLSLNDIKDFKTGGQENLVQVTIKK
eukprot:TRINITY_DN60010_c0_g1_i1.p2 TRINITY_DN60010_c0_g1~~TRINITY_DN60010_c0_g1_i1.p2  ORF type:complete len:128 (+),score=42.43 TRINITY_DN60010_c0_g1_i1:186-569(+)